MKTGTTETTSTSSIGGRLLDQVNDAARQNPIAAGAIAIGVFWMFFGSKRLAQLSARLPAAAEAAASGVNSMAGATVKAVADPVAATAARATGALNVAAGKIASAAHDAIDQFRSTDAQPPTPDSEDTGFTASRQAVAAIGDRGSEIANNLRSRLASAIEAEPLVVGVIGLAIGAGIASAFPASSLERTWLGETSAEVTGQMRKVFDDTTDALSDRANETLSEARRTAEARGLTVDTGAAVLKSTGGKIGAIAEAAQNSLKNNMGASG